MIQRTVCQLYRMTSTRSMLMSAVQIFLFLDFVWAQFANIDRAPVSSMPQDSLGKSYVSRSAQKCMQYRAIDSDIMWRPTCSDPEPKEQGSTTVAGGRNPQNRTFSHLVALGRKNENNEFVLYCGGTLIAASWVITAAHCTHGTGGGVNTALLGIRNIEDKNGVLMDIRKIIRHPSYKPPALYGDIALLELKEPVTFSESIKPACLDQPSNDIPYSAWVRGWGATEFGGSGSNRLQEAEISILNNTICAKVYDGSIQVPVGIQSSMLCAGSPFNNWEQDACQGDSGGPLQIVHKDWRCLYQIIGITSFGSGCAFVDSPGVYTKISHYLDWIEDIVWPAYWYW